MCEFVYVCVLELGVFVCVPELGVLELGVFVFMYVCFVCVCLS